VFLKYASKFIELSRFSPAYVVNETLKMNRFRSGLNHKLKVSMSVCTCSFYQEICDTAINVERAQNEWEAFFNKQGDKRKEKPQDHQNHQP